MKHVRIQITPTTYPHPSKLQRNSHLESA